MKLPDIEYGPVQESSSAIARVSQAQRQALDTVGAGLQAFSQEMIKTQSQKAGADVEAGMAADEADLSSQRYVPVAQVKAELGDAFEQLPQDIREHREIVDDGKGGQVEVVPTYLVAGALFDKRTKTRIEEASKNIPGQGWQAAFQDAALADLTQRKRGLAVQQAHAMVEDFKQTQLATVDQYVRGRAWDQALATIDHSDALSPGEKAQQREEVLARRQRDDAATAKVAQAARVEASSAAILQTARIPGYAWVDPAKALAAVDALSASDPAKDDVRKLVEHQVEKAEQLREQAGKQQMNQAQSALNRGFALESAQLAPIKTWMLDPANGAADKWDALERGVRAEQRASRTSTTEDRRIQLDLDRTALATFDGLPLRGEAGQDQVSADLATMFPDTSRLGLAQLGARQKRAAKEWEKNQGVPRKDFVAKADETAGSLGYGKKDTASFRSYMLDQLATWADNNPTKSAPTAPEVDAMLVDAVTVRDVKYGYDKETWRLRRAGAAVLPPPAGDQPERVQAVTGRRGGTATPTPAPGTPDRKTLKNGKTYEKRGADWYEVP